MKRTASVKKSSKSKASSTNRAIHLPRLSSPKLRYVVCVRSGANIDLEALKIYRVRRDAEAVSQGLLRVVDASGEDYLYPIDWFQPVQASQRLFQLVEELAT